MSYHIARRLADPSSPTAPSLIYRLYLVARCAPTRGDVSCMHSWEEEKKEEWAGEHFIIFVASSFGPLRVNPLFTFNYTAN